VDLIYQNAATLLTKANIASPAFTGVPTAPTAALGTNTTQLATTAFVTTEVALKANLASPAFTGIPTAPTASAGTNTTQLATTAFVATATTGVAPLASPAFTGVPTAPTATAGTNTTQLATTAFVRANTPSRTILADNNTWTGTNTYTVSPIVPTPVVTDTTTKAANMAAINQAVTGYTSIDVSTAVGGVLTITEAQYRLQWLGFTGTLTSDLIIEFPRLDGKTIALSNNVAMGSYSITMRMQGQASTNPLYSGISYWILTNTSTSRLASLIGTTQHGNCFYNYDIATNDNSYRLANTAFVQDLAALKAPLVSPALTGVPTAPTAATATSNTQIATTAFTHAVVNANGGGIVASGTTSSVTWENLPMDYFCNIVITQWLQVQ
jgi:hypothetical protein